MELKDKILDAVRASGYLAQDALYEQMQDEKTRETMFALVDEGELIRTHKGKLTLPENAGFIKGRLEIKRGGFGFVRWPEGDVFVAQPNLNGAFNGETVLVKVIEQQEGDRNKEGKVVKIIGDKPYTVVGTFKRGRSSAFVICDDVSVDDVFIPKQYKNGAKDGQKVLISIYKRRSGSRSAEGKVIEVLGYTGDKGVDILAVARTFNLTEEFPPAVLQEAGEIGAVSEKELEGRETLFNKVVITIDGDDAKDLDDAVSLEKLPGGNMSLGVHIADVSHYVTSGSKLNTEALKRGTSVYLIDKVIPMLPKQLSNGICSLNEGEVRLTLSCFMEINPEGHVASHRIVETAIRSRHRMTYKNVNRMLEDKDAEVIKKYEDIYPMLKDMQELAATLRNRREEAGSIGFDIDEAKIEVDAQGKPVSVGLRERGTGEKLIEEFMLIANETVAEEYFFAELPFLYRVHETPDADKMRELSVFLTNFGYRIKGIANLHPRAIQEVLQSAQGTPQENIINRVTLRSLKKAKYDFNNLGHFGLASHAYCHFTSPIRRYPDLMVHRIIKENLTKGLTPDRIDALERELPDIAKQTSDSEVQAIEAERKIEDIKKTEYIANYIGTEFEGVVSGVMPVAIFVELHNTIEGIIPLREIKDDYYNYNKEMYCVIGEHTRRKISLGDPVKIVVHSADVNDGRAEFRLV